MTHQCPATGCTVKVDGAKLMCRLHWFTVPRPLRDAVWAAWDHGRGAGTPAHHAAISDAIEAVNNKLGTP